LAGGRGGGGGGGGGVEYLTLQGENSKEARSTMTSFGIIRQLGVKSIKFVLIIKFSSSMKILYD